MQRFTASVYRAIDDKNWYAALALALTLPDICNGLDEKKGHRAFADWFEKYMSKHYISMVGPKREKSVFLTGDDFYALRCAYLHGGTDEILGQRARQILEKFEFCAPIQDGIIHCNLGNDIVLQLQVDIFCKQICDGVLSWIDDVLKKDVEVQKRSRDLLKVV